MRILPTVFVAGTLVMPVNPAAAQHAIAVVPQPVKVTARPGHFTLTRRTIIWTDRTSASVGRQFARFLEPASGFILRVQVGGTPPAGSVAFRIDSSLKGLGAEGYHLDVHPTRVVARAPELSGLFYAGQTMRQLLPPEIFRAAPASDVEWIMPALTIEDYPRFSWRGALLDTARHFMPKAFILKYIDLLALHKLNTFHWHLTDDQGWRLEIKRYPKLTEVGAWRKETIVGRQRAEEQAQLEVRRHSSRRLLHAGRCARGRARTRRPASSPSSPKSRCPGTRWRRSPRIRSSA